MRNGLKLHVVSCAVASVMLLCGTAFGQGLLPFAGMGQSGATSNNYFEFFSGIGVTGARAGFFYGWGDIRVEDVVALGQNNILLWQDFASFVHHRKADLRDAYFSDSDRDRNSGDGMPYRAHGYKYRSYYTV